MARGTGWGVVLLLMSGSLLAAPVAQAQQANWAGSPGNVKLGPIEVHGELSQLFKYDDNIFIEPEDEVDDVIFVTRPTVNFVLPGQRFNGNVLYSVGLRAFLDNEQENSQDHTLDAALAYFTPRGNFFRLQDTYLDTTDLSTSEEQSNIAPRTRWHSNRARAVLGLLEIPNLERIDLEVGYTFDTRYFDREENKSEDRYINEIDVRWYYDVSHFLPKTRWVVEYIYGNVNYDEGVDVRRDGDHHVLRTGVSIAPTAKLSGTATAGVEFRDFDFPPHPSLGVTEPQDLELFSVGIDLRYRYRTQQTFGEVGAVSFAAVHEISETAFRFDERIEPVHELTRFDLGVQHRLSSLPLTLFANVFYEFDEFPGVVEVLPLTGVYDEREDDFFGGSLRLRLDGRFPGKNLNIFTETGYQVENRDSNFEHKDYLANRAWVMIGANF